MAKIYPTIFQASFLYKIIGIAILQIFKKLENLEDNHSKYSVSYIETLVNNSKIDEAFKFSNKLKKEMNFFNSDLVIQAN